MKYSPVSADSSLLRSSRSIESVALELLLVASNWMRLWLGLFSEYKLSDDIRADRRSGFETMSINEVYGEFSE